MKKLLVSIFVITLSFASFAQIATPQPSPFSKLEQKVGLTDVTVEYSRPSMRGRTIFGDLVPYSKMWRTGANKNTIVTFSDDVLVKDQPLKAGSYAIFTVPNQGSWAIMFYSDTENWGTPQKWDESKVAATLTSEVYELPMDIETFTISINNMSTSGADLGIMWENTYVSLPFTVPTDAKVTSAITKVMNGPSAGDYYAAAVYYSSEGKDIAKAQEWMDKAMSMTKSPKYWQLRQQSLIYAKGGNKKAAIEAAKKSLAGAEEAGNADYVKMNTDSLKEWGGM